MPPVALEFYDIKDYAYEVFLYCFFKIHSPLFKFVVGVVANIFDICARHLGIHIQLCDYIQEKPDVELSGY